MSKPYEISYGRILISASQFTIDNPYLILSHSLLFFIPYVRYYYLLNLEFQGVRCLF